LSPATPAPEWNEAVRAEGAPRERFLESHVALVRYVALRIASRLPANVDVEDLVHDGVLGLIDAVQKYDPARRVRFRTYAEQRVRGAILDGLRHRDWKPRTIRRSQRELDQTLARLTTERGSDVTEDEIAAEMGVGVEQLRQLLLDASSGPLLPLDELPCGSHPVLESDDGQPHATLERKELLQALAQELVGLPDRERQVLELYYHEGLNMKEVGAVMGVTESRVCQLHAQAAARLRVALRTRLHPAAVVVNAGDAR